MISVQAVMRQLMRWHLLAAVALAAGLTQGVHAAAPERGQPPAKSVEQQRLTQLRAELTANGQRRADPIRCLAGALELARLLPLVPPGELRATLADLQSAWVHRSEMLGSPALRVVQRLADALGAPRGDTQGYVTALSWLGPFGDEHGTALARVGEVESEAMTQPISAPQAQRRGRNGELRWQVLPPEALRPGRPVALDELVDRPDDALVYVQSWIRPQKPEQAGRVRLRLGVDGPARLWLGGQVLGGEHASDAGAAGIGEKPETFGIDPAVPSLPPVDEVAAVLRPGWQRLLIKLAPAGASLPLSVQVVDEAGRPLAIDCAALPVGASAVAGEAPTLPTQQSDAVEGIRWREATLLQGPPASALLQMAWHGWPMPAALGERLLAVGVDELPADPQIALAHAMLAGEAGDRLARLQAWRARLPAELSLLVAHARALDESGQTAEAHRLWQSWSSTQRRIPEDESVDACRTRVAIWSHMSADSAAQGLLLRCTERWPGLPRLLRDRAQRLAAADHWKSAAQLHGAAVKLLDVPETRGDWLTALAEAGQLERAQVEAEKLIQQAPLRSRVWEALARYHLDDGDLATAEKLLQRVPAAQRRTAWHDVAGRLAQRLGQRETAIGHWRTAAALSPQRSDLRARLQLMARGSAFYADARRDLLAMVQRERGQPRSHAAEIRWRQTVLHSLGNGQQARYEAEVWYFGKGAPPSHSAEIDYAPSLSEASVLQAVVVRADGRLDRQVSQEVDRYTEDASGMYFDLERLTLGFKNLKPGDAVVIEHVVHDLGPAPFGLVFGELIALGDSVPVRETQVAIRLPQGTPLYAQLHTPDSDDPQPGPGRKSAPEIRSVGRAEDGGPWQQWSWTLGPFAAAANEADAPGFTERVAYLHASSFANWNEVVRWYQGLLQGALPARGADPLIRELAQRLAQGRDTPEAQVRAVYDFARSQVRYVGLEFGIHSIKPHSAREVAQRQFGDCKDKATLIAALLAELGIEAQVALVRTADNGRLADGVASLGVFNHAIAYVPSLGWWLDATATHHGPLELPAGDGGGMALLIHEGRAKLEELPGPELDEQSNQLETDVTLDGKGGAQLQWRGLWRGLGAAEARRLLANGTRKDKLEDELAGRWPGLKAEAVQATGVDPLGDEVTAQLQGRVAALGRKQGDGWVLVPLRPDRPWQERLARAESRKTELILPAPLNLSETVRLHLPPGWRATGTGEKQKITWDGASFSLQAQVLADGVELRAHLELPERRIAPEDYGRFRAWLGQVDAALRAEVAVAPEPR